MSGSTSCLLYTSRCVEETVTDESRSALDTMLYDCRCRPQQARDRLAAFGFRGEDVMTPDVYKRQSTWLDMNIDMLSEPIT